MNKINRIYQALQYYTGRPSGGYITQAERERAKKRHRKKK